MAHRAIITRYSDEALDADGDILLSAYFICVDPATPLEHGKILVAPVVLDATLPATWTATIKAAVAAWGVANGCPDLVVGNVFAPAYA